MQKILLVDEKDNVTGVSNKTEIHIEGLLHRAFSVFIMNSNSEMLIQQRALSKYHSGGLWSNTCCGHFTSEENSEAQAEQRLMEEMGIKSTLRWVFNYRYNTQLENGLIENELVYAYLGFYEGIPVVDAEEAESWRWINLDELIGEMQQQPEKFTYWFRFVVDKILHQLKQIRIE